MNTHGEWRYSSKQLILDVSGQLDAPVAIPCRTEAYVYTLIGKLTTEMKLQGHAS
jgi:hypothetical protein